jgi:hypothetical protein
MNTLIIAALIGAPTALAGGVGLLRLSARLSVVEWNGPDGHPRHMPRVPAGELPELPSPAKENAR